MIATPDRRRYLRKMNAPQRIYLDHNATSPLCAPARRAMADAVELFGNPSSVHSEGRAARRLVEEGRDAVAALIGGRPREIIFTSGGTEANNQALSGAPAASLVISAVEHMSVREAAERSGRPFFVCPVDENGVVEMEAFERMVETAPAPALVSVMLANNETGVIQPIRDLAACAHAHGALFHCDAVQGPGRLAIDVEDLGVDLLSLSGHKLGAPKGVGALWVRSGIELRPLIVGGGQEFRHRAGTENVPGIAGFGAAAIAAGRALRTVDRVRALRDRLEAAILEAACDARIFGAAAPRVANTSAIYMPGMAAETQVMAFDLEGIAISAGSACSSGKVQPSHVIAAMGATPEEAQGVIRVSLGAETTKAEVERFVAVWRAFYERAAERRVGAV